MEEQATEKVLVAAPAESEAAAANDQASEPVRPTHVRASSSREAAEEDDETEDKENRDPNEEEDEEEDEEEEDEEEDEEDEEDEDEDEDEDEEKACPTITNLASCVMGKLLPYVLVCVRKLLKCFFKAPDPSKRHNQAPDPRPSPVPDLRPVQAPELRPSPNPLLKPWFSKSFEQVQSAPPKTRICGRPRLK